MLLCGAAAGQVRVTRRLHHSRGRFFEQRIVGTKSFRQQQTAM